MLTQDYSYLMAAPAAGLVLAPITGFCTGDAAGVVAAVLLAALHSHHLWGKFPTGSE